jgi:exopolysaccharide biosynthesis polyprenyl glycosylphosphotransferase
MYLSLFLVLLIRYGRIDSLLINAHIGPFSIIFSLWLIIFYIVGLYDLRTLKKGYEPFQQLFVATVVGTAIAMALFYLIPSFHISPKTSLAIFSGVFIVFQMGWRFLFRKLAVASKRNVLLIGGGNEIAQLEKFVFDNPQLGYKICFQIQDAENIKPEMIKKIVEENKINTIIINHRFGLVEEIFNELYKYMTKGLEIVTLALAYEAILKKLPISEVKDFSLVSEISQSRRIYETIKRPIEVIVSFLLILITALPMILILALVKLTSKGPGIYKQVRVGKNEKHFVLYKFRTMKENAEADGPKWSLPDDDRVTWVGKILRFTHLDELPQLFNILKGDMSFVGPRPERPEFVETLKKVIPYYEIRSMVKPGITGWAQVNYKYGSSTQDALEKLQFDLFYIKNRSVTLDILIILKTIKMFVFNYK